MSKYKISIIFMICCFLVQTSIGESADSFENSHLTPKLSFLRYVISNFFAMIEEYSNKSIKVIRKILQDEEFNTHHEPLVEEFKNNLTIFIESSNDIKLDALNMFSNTADYYYEIPEDKITPETKYIVEVLNKYHYKDIENEMVKEFTPFEENFKKMFEEFKKEWDDRALDWYEKYQNIQGFKEKLNAFTTLKIF